jgi:peptidoglycan-associated lipoprotein
MRGEKAAPAPSAQAPKAGPSEGKKEIQVAPKGAETVPVGMLKDVHFDFDRYVIRPQDVEILKQNLPWFKANPARRVRVEGNCDERGTVEYNLALGQKRADATKAYLVTLGVDATLLDTVSYGKERPIDPGHNEAAWAKNRRAHLEPLK